MTDSRQCDVLIIGGGPGGTPAALALAAKGKRVILVEAGQGLGGTCLFEGCIPSKIFRETAARRRAAREMSAYGLMAKSDAPPPVDWNTVLARKEKILTMRSQAALAKARQIPGLEVIFGRARLTGPRQAVIETEDGALQVQFAKAIISTGSVPRALPIEGADLPGVLDSQGLVGLKEIPRSLTLIGGGPIGVEMAQIFSMLGTQVTLLEAAPRILGPADPVLAGLLQKRLEDDGITVLTGVGIEAIRQVEDELVVFLHHDGKGREVAAQRVAIAAGRVPNVEGLGLETTAIAHDAHGIKVNGHLETDEPGIFATGDVTGPPMFAHWATAQALAVAAHMLGMPAPFPKPEHNSAVIFSSPELGMAGLTEEAARAAGLDVAVAEYDYKVDARAQISLGGFGRLRIVHERASHRIVGIHALVEGASELMGEAALAVRLGLRLEDVAQAIHPHPTLTESFAFAARAALMQKGASGARPDGKN